MVESCFPADFLKAWNRSNFFSTNTDAKERLNNLMQFLKKEIEGEERIPLAAASFGLGKNLEYKSFKKKQFSSENLRNKVPKAMGLLTSTSISDVKKACIFCEGKMVTGRRKVLSSGLVAVETYLGWTLMGEVPQEEPSEESLAMTVLSLYVNEAGISNLWKLNLIGINDPVEKKSNSSTTPFHPVFDASARLANYPSLNQCFACGPNLIEFILDILLRFREREREFGVIADIRKAFQKINIRKQDRDFLRFLWREKMDEKKLRVFRYTRVVFGVKCSPFLLASVIEYHIQKCEFEKSFNERLWKSFYVDNVVTSVDSKDKLNECIANSKTLMAKGGFDLREWEWSGDWKIIQRMKLRY
ncbi:uncharacterized protein TNCV_1268661 [Trichonephila clavipes]|nr:uncharacterized protein TNCV_1268661 [Trichonephila clavipes]